MKYIRCFFIILLIVISASSIFAATSYEGKKPPAKGSSYKVGFDVELSSLSLSDVGFASAAVNKIDGAVSPISYVSVKNEIKGGNGTFESDEFYIYWKLLGSGSKFPELWLKQEGVLNNANLPDVEVNWAVDLKSNEQGASYMEVLNSTTFNVNGVKIYPTIEPVAAGDENKLAVNAASYAVKLKTVEPYWKKPNAVYTSELWLIVKPK